MGFYNYHPDVNDGNPLECNECGKPVEPNQPVYFLDLSVRPIIAEHASCAWERADREEIERRKKSA